jgi:hypothetical protein
LLESRTFAVLAVCVSLLPWARARAAQDLRFDQVLDQVSKCEIDIERYARLWVREDAILINLPNSGAINGILVTQFYVVPGRAGGPADYGIVLNAPVAQVQSSFPELDGVIVINGRKRQLLPLVRETGNPRNRGQTLLICRGPLVV